MSFKPGSKVRITNAGETKQLWLEDYVGMVVTVDKDKGGYFELAKGDYTVGRGGYEWGIWNGNAELVTDRLDEQIAAAKAKLEALEAEKESRDLQPFVKAGLGSFATHRSEYDNTYRYVKVAPNSWVLINTVERSDPGKVFRNENLARMNAEVER